MITYILFAVAGAVIEHNIGIVDKAIKFFEGAWEIAAAWIKKIVGPKGDN